ncbi:MAG TPA: hypothetical protein PKG52_09260 [bacterium]|nr:hypothetical protein [bacterium]HPS29457.1 hypothetical protein [bacterium]
MDIFESIKNDADLIVAVKYMSENTDINNNSLKNFIRYLREINVREKLPYREILQKIAASEVIENNEITKKTKSEEILKKLYNLRYPLWSAKQAEFIKLKNRFRALTGGEIEFPEFAEGNSFKISFTIKKDEDIEKIFETISKGHDLMKESLKKIKE